MYAVDLHAHTRFFHGFEGRPTAFDPTGARLLGFAARARGLDAVALTNHDYYADIGESLGDVAAIPGIEVSTTEGHVLVVGPDPPRRTEPGGLTPAEAVALAHDRGCVAVVAHPFRASAVRASDAAFDAVELNGKAAPDWPRVRALADRLDVPVVGGSDAHWPFEVGRAYTLVDAESCTPEHVVRAVRDGDVWVGVRSGPLERALRPIYRRYHRWKGDLENDAPGGDG